MQTNIFFVKKSYIVVKLDRKLTKEEVIRLGNGSIRPDYFSDCEVEELGDNGYEMSDLDCKYDIRDILRSEGK